jgi:hypothetical protein
MSERRDPSDRRRRPTPWLSRHWLAGRRKGGRRAGEGKDVYVDRYRAWEWAAVAALLLLCLADLVLTLDVLDRGGEEVNPVMRWALERGVGTFAVLKLGLTLLGALVLLLRVRFRWMRQALLALVAAYVVLIGYHAVLQGRLPERPAATQAREAAP